MIPETTAPPIIACPSSISPVTSAYMEATTTGIGIEMSRNTLLILRVLLKAALISGSWILVENPGV